MKFLRSVVQHIRERGVDWRKVCLVIPSKRCGVFIQKHISDLEDKPVWSPRMLTMSEMAQEISRYEMADPIELTFELYESYLKVDPQPVDFKTFESWAPGILSDFGQIDTYQREADAVFQDLKNLSEINEWGFHLGEEQGDRKLSEFDEFHEFWSLLGPLYHEFRHRLDAASKAYPGMMMREAAENIHQSGIFADYDLVCFIGLNALSKAEESIIQHVHQEGKLLMCLDHDRFYLDNPYDSAGLFQRLLIENQWPTYSNPHNGLSQPNKKIECIAAVNSTAQARIVGAELSKITEEDLEDIAIVLGDENLLMPLLESLPTVVDKVNITMGIPIRQTAMFRLIDGYLALHEQAEKRLHSGAARAFHHTAFVDWLAQPLISTLDENGGYATLAKRVVENNMVYVQQENVEDLIGADVHQDVVLSALFLASEPSAHIAHLDAILDRLKENETDVIKKGVVFVIRGVIEKLAGFLDRYAFLNDTTSLRALMRRTIANEQISFVGEPLQGVQIMGLLESRALDFKRLFLLGVNEGTLPKSRSYKSVLPYEIRKFHELPTYKEQDAIFAYYFYRLIQYPAHVHLLYVSERDEMGGGEPSRFIQQIEAHVQKGTLPFQMEHITITSSSGQDVDFFTSYPNDPDCQEKILAYFSRGVSASGLNTFFDCPLDFYFKYVLGIREENEVEEEMGSATVGSIVHRVLEMLFEKHENQIIDGQLLAKFRSEAKNHMSEAFEHYGMHHNMNRGYNLYMRSVIERLVDDELAMEQSLKSAPMLLGTEVPIEHTLPFEIDGQEVEVKFKGFIDRMEKEEGILRLIDYKSGKVGPGDLHLNAIDFEAVGQKGKPKAIQLLLYAFVYLKSNQEVEKVETAIISLRNLKEGKMPLTLGSEKRTWIGREDLPDIEQFFRELLRAIYRQQEFSHKDKAPFCAYCPEWEENKW